MALKFKLAMMAAGIAGGFFFGSTILAAAGLERSQANLRFNLALTQYKAGRLDEAEASLREALKLAPGHTEASLLLGVTLSRKERFSEAEPLLSTAARQSQGGQAADAWNNLGVARFQLGHLAEAEDAFEKSRQADPTKIEAWLNLGVLGLKQKRWKLALDSFTQVSRLDPRHFKGWLGLAEAAGYEGKKAERLIALRKANDLKPDDKELKLDLADALYQNDLIDESVRSVEPLLGQQYSAAEFLMGVLHYRQGRFDESTQSFEKALNLKPDYPEARFNLAITLYDQGHYDQALAQFDKVLKNHPDDAKAKENREYTLKLAVREHLKSGSQLFLSGDYAKALNRWKEAKKLDPTNRVVHELVETAEGQLKLQAEDFSIKGLQAKEEGRTSDAIAMWSQALDRDPFNERAKAGLIALSGEVKRQIEVYQKEFKRGLDEGDLARSLAAVEKLAPLDRELSLRLKGEWEKSAAKRQGELVKAADILEKKGDWAAVLERLQSAFLLSPNDSALQLRVNLAKATLRNLLQKSTENGQAAEKAGDFNKAAREYRKVLNLEPGNSEAKIALERLQPKTKTQTKVPNAAEIDDWYYQGVYAYAAGQTEKALELWNRVLKVKPDHQLASEAARRAQKRLKALSQAR